MGYSTDDGMVLYLFLSHDRRYIRAWTTDEAVAKDYEKKLGMKPEVFIKEKEQ